MEQAYMKKTEEDNISMKSSSEEEELRRAEEYKSNGNELFKSKFLDRFAKIFDYAILASFNKIRIFICPPLDVNYDESICLIILQMSDNE